MINPIFSAGMAASIGRKVKCPSCGYMQIIGKPRSGSPILCKKCRYAFARKSIARTPRRHR